MHCSGGQTLLDGLQSNWWFYAVGSYESWPCRDCFPSWSDNETRVVELYLWSRETSFEYTYDSTRPSITVTSRNGVSGFTSNDDTISLTFSLSESVSDFTVDDVTVSGGGTLSDFNQDSIVTVYTATFTPDESDGVNTVTVNENVFSDYAGNVNEKSNEFQWHRDTTNPQINIVSQDLSTESYVNTFDTFTVSFEISEAETTFDESNVHIVGGSIVSFTASNDSHYTAVILPDSNNDESEVVIHVPESQFVDIAQNSNLMSDSFRIMIDTTNPRIEISSPDGENSFHSSDDSIELVFSLSEEIPNFDIDDINVTGGHLRDFYGMETVYMATLVASGEVTMTVEIGMSSVFDVAGNGNEMVSFGWTRDVTSPQITILPLSGFHTNQAAIELTFNVSELTDFAASKVTTHGGSLTSFTSLGDNIYSATFTSNGANEDKDISVDVSTTTDLAGNTNNVAASLFFTYDTEAPYVVYSSLTSMAV